MEAKLAPQPLRAGRSVEYPRTRHVPFSTPVPPDPAVRRLLDAGLALGLIVLTSPLWLLVAFVIKLTSRGPVLFCQQRVGRGGHTFIMWKFRSMHEHAERETGPVWACRGDARVTRLGGLIRRFSIDELPQLVNVVRGEMSLVGPRPERPYFVKQFSATYPQYEERHAVPPGITGWAQVRGWRGDTSLEQRLQCDLYYVKHRSLWFDLRILLATPRAVFYARNAV